jgi:hypothetical protein
LAQDDSRRQKAKKDSKRATLPIDRILRNPFLNKTGDVKLKIAKPPRRTVFWALRIYRHVNRHAKEKLATASTVTR